MDNEIIYLDNNATTQLDPSVIEEMLPFLTKYYGNPSSGYGFAAMARKAINLARERVAALLGCEPTEVIFTSGGTESNNAVINSALHLEARGGPLVASAVEHSAVLRPCQDLAKRGCDVTFMGGKRKKIDRHIAQAHRDFTGRLYGVCVKKRAFPATDFSDFLNRKYHAGLVIRPHD